MRYKISRFLQFVGLVILPIGVAGNLAERLSLWESLILAGAGMAVFYLGWFLQPKEGP